jgi:hypothetical protein
VPKIPLQVHFSRYRTWAWISEGNLIQPRVGETQVSRVSPIDEGRIRRAVERELAAKGYRKVAGAEADLIVSFSIGEEEKTKITSTPSAGAGYDDYGYGDRYGGSTVRGLLLPMPHWVSPKHLQRYLDEFVLRFDRRWKEAELFPRVLHCAIDTKPFPYHRLTAERSG